MKKVLAISSVMLGVVFLAGCGQQPLSQTQPTTPAPVTQAPAQPIVAQPAPIATQPVENQPTSIDQPGNNDVNSRIYTSNNLGISFQYPKGWFVREDRDDSRVYIENTQEDVNKGNMPADFQRVWISTWAQEVSAQTENNVKNGKPDGREISGSVSTATINSNGVVINTYEYKTIGGSTLQAFWTDKSGKRYYATNSTEVGDANQQKMVENLKKILATVKFTK